MQRQIKDNCKIKATNNINLLAANNKSLLLLLTLMPILLLLILAPSSVSSVKCYMCQFHLGYCTNPLDCYNQPDYCSNMNFSPVLAQTTECEFGCQQYLVTDATGSIMSWRRGCATESSPKSSYICLSQTISFLRHDQCWCHSDYCNSSSRSQVNQLLMIVLGVIATIMMRMILSN